MRLFWSADSKTLPLAAAQTAISVATADPAQHDPRLPFDKKVPRELRRPRNSATQIR